MCAWYPADSMASHPWPDVNVGTHKGPLPGAPTVGVSSKHQRVNLYLLRVGPGWCAKRHKVYTGSGRMTLRLVCCAACVISTERFIVGGTNGRERDRSQVSDGKVERIPRAWLLLSCVLCVKNNRSKVGPLSGVPCPPFIDQGGT